MFKKNHLLFSILLLIFCSGCWEQYLDQPSFAYVNDIIEIKINLFYNSPINQPFSISGAMQIPEDWEFMSILSIGEKFQDFEPCDVILQKAKKLIRSKPDYKWISMRSFDNSFSKIDATLIIRLKTGNKPMKASLDYYIYGIDQKNYEVSYKIEKADISVIDLKSELDISNPCSYKGESSEVVLNFANFGNSQSADLYFVLKDNHDNFFSYPNWQEGVYPFIKNFNIPLNANFENKPIFKFKYPSENPEVKETGLYTFYFIASEPDKAQLLGKIGIAEYFVGNEPPIADLVIWGDNKCEGVELIFDSSGSWDFCDSDDELMIRFDFEGDSIWDTEFQTTKIMNWSFPSPFIYNPTIEVKDSGGLISTKSIQIKVSERDGNWSVTKGPRYSGDYVRFTIEDNLVKGDFSLTYLYIYGVSKYTFSEYLTHKGNFNGLIENEKFISNQPKYFDFEIIFDSCNTAIVDVTNNWSSDSSYRLYDPAYKRFYAERE